MFDSKQPKFHLAMAAAGFTLGLLTAFLILPKSGVTLQTSCLIGGSILLTVLGAVNYILLSAKEQKRAREQRGNPEE